MSSVRQVGSHDVLLKRMCLSCGYDGQQMQESLEAIDFCCPACDEDLYTRPPRSYVQMEGLTEPTVVVSQVQLQEWSQRLSHLERQAHATHRSHRVVGLILGSALLAAAAASVVFLSI